MKLILGYQLRKLDRNDLILLSILYSSMLIWYLLDAYQVYPQTFYCLNLIIPIIGGVVVICTPMGLRFKNVLFGILWFLAYVNLYMLSGNDYFFIPVFGFVYYQVIRTIYYTLYKREFIPLWIERGRLIQGRFSKLESRRSKSIDISTMYLLFIGGHCFGLLSYLLMDLFFYHMN